MMHSLSSKKLLRSIWILRMLRETFSYLVESGGKYLKKFSVEKFSLSKMFRIYTFLLLTWEVYEMHRHVIDSCCIQCKWYYKKAVIGFNNCYTETYVVTALPRNGLNTGNFKSQNENSHFFRLIWNFYVTTYGIIRNFFPNKIIYWKIGKPHNLFYHLLKKNRARY
jgi:hypothetical protein